MSTFELRILVISRDRETRDSVQSYLSLVGATTACVSDIGEVPEAIAQFDALLLFADDYAPIDVLELVARVTSRHCVVVTSTVDPADLLRSVPRESSKLVVLRRPAWGWMLLDALRSALDRDGAKVV